MNNNEFNILPTKRYPVIHPLLKKLIKFYWVIKSASPLEIKHKLLPMGNIDFVFNFGAPISYVTNEKTELVPKAFHFHGIRDQFYLINSSGDLNVFGISFQKEGLYPLLKRPVSEFANHLIELDWLFQELAANIAAQAINTVSVFAMITMIEKELLKVLDTELIPSQNISRLIEAFNAKPPHCKIQRFCDQSGVNRRSLERIFATYIGVSPKKSDRINRFKKVIDQLSKNKIGDLVSLAYDYDFFDQTHFIKDFKTFTGSTPTRFLLENATIKQITVYQ